MFETGAFQQVSGRSRAYILYTATETVRGIVATHITEGSFGLIAVLQTGRVTLLTIPLTCLKEDSLSHTLCSKAHQPARKLLG